MSTWRLNYWILPELSTAGNLNTTLVDLFVVMTSSGSVFGVHFTFKFYQLTHAHTRTLQLQVPIAAHKNTFNLKLDFCYFKQIF